MRVTDLRSWVDTTSATHERVPAQLGESLQAWYETSTNAMTEKRFLALQLLRSAGSLSLLVCSTRYLTRS